jgi:DNA-binding MarR family transcriptional regulator
MLRAPLADPEEEPSLSRRRPDSPATSNTGLVERDLEQIIEELEPPLEFLRNLWALNHALERTSVRMEATLGLTAQQRFVLRLLGKLPGIMPAQLAALLHVDRGSVTATIKRLEARELVIRKPDYKDRRRVSLHLTARGRKLDVPAKLSVEHAVTTALERTTPSDLAAVRRVLARVVQALDDVSQGDEK